MESGSAPGVLLATSLLLVGLSGCLTEVLDPEDETEPLEPFTRIEAISVTSSQSQSCDLATSELNGPCLEFQLEPLDGVTCDPPQIFLELVKGKLSRAEKDLRELELAQGPQPGMGDPYVSCQYLIPWSVTGNFLYPDSSLVVRTSHNKSTEAETCEADSLGSCTARGMMEGEFTFEGPNESKDIVVKLQAEIQHDLEMLISSGDIDYEAELTLRT